MTMPRYIFVISHRRSGTHLLIDAIRNNFDRYKQGYLNIDQLTSRHADPMTLKEFIERLEEGPRIIKSHMHGDYETYFENDLRLVEFVEQMLQSAKLIYVYRDGRDVLTSLYFYMRSFRPEIAETSFSEFIRMNNEFDSDTYRRSLNRIEYWRFHVNSWYGSGIENMIFVSFEETISDYEATIAKIGEFLGLQVPTRPRDVTRTGTIYTSFPRGISNLFDKVYKGYHKYIRNVEYTSVAFRKGRAGSYREHFSQEDLEYFYALTSNLMANLGY